MSKYYRTTLLSPREVKLNFRKKTQNKFQYGGHYMRIVVWYLAIYDGNPGFSSIYEAMQATPHSTYFIKKNCTSMQNYALSRGHPSRLPISTLALSLSCFTTCKL